MESVTVLDVGCSQERPGETQSCRAGGSQSSGSGDSVRWGIWGQDPREVPRDVEAEVG